MKRTLTAESSDAQGESSEWSRGIAERNRPSSWVPHQARGTTWTGDDPLFRQRLGRSVSPLRVRGALHGHRRLTHHDRGDDELRGYVGDDRAQDIRGQRLARRVWESLIPDHRAVDPHG